MKPDNLEKRIARESTKAEFKQKAKDFLGDAKIYMNQWINPAAFVAATNAAYLWGADQALDFVSREIERGNGLASAASYLLLGAGLVAANVGVKIKGQRIGILQGAKKIYEKNKKKYHDMRERLRKNPRERHSEKEKQMRRRDFIKTGIVGLAMLGTFYATDFKGTMDRFSYDAHRVSDGVKGFVNSFARPESTESKARQKKKGNADNAEIRLTIQSPRTGPFEVPAYLRGKNINGNLYGDYTGIHGVAGDTFNTDFANQLAKLWDKKISRMKSKGERNSTVMEARDNAVKEYSSTRNPTRMTLDQYVEQADKSIDFVSQNINWNDVARLKGLSSSELKLVKSIAGMMTGKDLLAYCLTEFMPDKNDGLKNKLMLDMLLRSAGREYVEFMPAIYDSMTSFGPYQFTSYALFEQGSEARGASLINKALPDSKKIPGSVIGLRGNDHHKAAYMFAINNISELVSRLNRVELDNLWKHHQKNKIALVQYIATAHNKPKDAIKAARLWLAHGCKTKYAQSCSRRILDYAVKTAVNFNAMQAGTGFHTTARVEIPPEALLGKAESKASANQANESYLVTVKKGQNLYRIALQNKTSVQKLKEWNNIYDNNIKPGQKLRIYRGKQ
ncbi:LysM peptidoglycan-binding domain-containing protein [Candidatus Woesearchaeota archaeon]|nr:LysM peptidoglycan-binding domain-containing protein [Candidatus Woesearchaeota archaeon]